MIINHHGIPGQRWGVIRNLQAQRRRLAKKLKKSGKSTEESRKVAKEEAKKKSYDKSYKKNNNNRKPKDGNYNKSYKKNDNNRKPKDGNYDKLSRIKKENELLDLSKNRWLPASRRSEAKQIFKDRNKYSFRELSKKQSEIQLEADLSKALGKRSATSSNIVRTLAKGTVDIAGAFSNRVNSNKGLIKAIVDSTDKNMSTDAVVNNILNKTFESAGRSLSNNKTVRSKVEKMVKNIPNLKDKEKQNIKDKIKKKFKNNK